MRCDIAVLKGLLGVTVLAVSLAGASVAIADEYSSTVEFPRMTAANQTNKVYVPVNATIPDGIKVKSVSWSWTQPNAHHYYDMKLCQMVTWVCKDVSLQKNGTSYEFGGTDAAVPFYFLITSVGRPFVPEWGVKGNLTVRW